MLEFFRKRGVSPLLWKEIITVPMFLRLEILKGYRSKNAAQFLFPYK